MILLEGMLYPWCRRRHSVTDSGYLFRWHEKGGRVELGFYFLNPHFFYDTIEIYYFTRKDLTNHEKLIGF